jgi:hypothetical protein
MCYVNPTMAVDIYGVLGPDEIYFKSSRREFVTQNGNNDLVTGDVLVSYLVSTDSC